MKRFLLASAGLVALVLPAFAGQAPYASSAGAAIVNATGPIRQIVKSGTPPERRYLVIAEATAAQVGAVVQTEAR